MGRGPAGGAALVGAGPFYITVQDVVDAILFLKENPDIGKLGEAEKRDRWIRSNNIQEWYKRNGDGWGGLLSY
jgi:hypothetical protein